MRRDVRPPVRASERDATTTTAAPTCRVSPEAAVNRGLAVSTGGRSNCGARQRGHDACTACAVAPSPLLPPSGSRFNARGGGGGGWGRLSRAGAAGALSARRTRVSWWCVVGTWLDEFHRCCRGGQSEMGLGWYIMYVGAGLDAPRMFSFYDTPTSNNEGAKVWRCLHYAVITFDSER